MDDSVKRILIIIGKLYIGGAERVAYDIGMCAETRKYRFVAAVCVEEEGECQRPARARCLRCRTMRSTGGVSVRARTCSTSSEEQTARQPLRNSSMAF